MKEKIVLSNNSPLNSLIQEIENTGTTVHIFRGQKVVAKIVPGKIEEVDSLVCEQYKTWGESLRSDPVRI